MSSLHSRALGATALAAILASPAFADSLAGRVVDSTGAAYLEGAQVTIVELGRTAESGTGGNYRFGDVAPGSYTLRTEYAGAEAVETAVTVAGDSRADIAIGPQADAYGESVLVIGQRANLASSISRQRAADGVENVLTRDAIGQFPDQNVAESVRRVPGVNVLNDQGEGRFIAIRGLDPNLNATSINGVRLPAPEADIKAVALDVIASELVESIEIKKTLTPDTDADAIGGSIEIKTPSAFDREGTFFGLTVEGSYSDLRDQVSPKAALDLSTVVDGWLGVSVGLSYYKREFSTDNIEASGWGETDDGVIFADTLEYRDYDVKRTRTGATVGLEGKVDDNTTLHIDALYSVFDDQEARGRLTFKLDEDPYAGDANSASFSSSDGEVRVERNLKDRFESQKIFSLVAGGTTYMDAWKFDYSAAYSRSSEKENGSLDPTKFRRDFEEECEGEGGESGCQELDVTFDYSGFDHIGYHINSGLDAFLDPSEYEFDEIERTALSDAVDKEYAFTFDAQREFALDSGGQVDIQFGAKARLRDKTYDFELDLLDGFEGDFTLADVLGQQSYGLAEIDPIPGIGAVRQFLSAHRSEFERNDFDSAFESAIADYDVEEDIYAGYLLGRYDSGPLRVIGGVRVEHTQTDAAGNQVELVEEGAIRDGVELEEDTLFIAPVSFSKEYTDWLPSLSLRYDATDDVVLRAGVYRAVVRPTPGQIAPRFVVEENDEGEREGEFGNPDLEPYDAWNFDATAEYYFAKNAVVSAGAFYKSIDNFIVVANFEDVTFNGVFATEALIPINGESAEVFGIEANFAAQLDFLPDPFDGFLVGLNYTYTDSEGDVPDGDGGLRSISLPASAEHTVNAMLGYEKGPLSIRVAAAYRSGYLDELGDEPDEDRYVKDHLQWDVTMKYRVTPEAQVFAEFVNLSDEPYVAYQKGPGGDRLLQYEEYSWTAKAGFRLTL